jgi:hypothetical protein
MTTGALIFAFNNEQTDYVGMAAWSAQNIRRHLGIPVAVVTDATDDPRLTAHVDQVIPAVPESGGTRYFEDYAATVTWHNAGRTDAYTLSPWDQTLVLDADYVVAGDQLSRVLAMPQDFVCHRWAKTVDHNQSFYQGNNWFGRPSMPMYWATVMMFRRSNHAAYVFDCMQMIRHNWLHYRELYGIDRATYRNDFALSIALGIVSGHTPTMSTIPWPLISVLPEQTVQQVTQDHYQVKYQDSQGRLRHYGLNGIDLHVMGKQSLEALIASR